MNVRVTQVTHGFGLYGVPCTPSPSLPFPVVLLCPCGSQIPSGILGKHWNHLLPHRQAQRARHGRSTRRLGLRMVYMPFIVVQLHLPSCNQPSPHHSTVQITRSRIFCHRARPAVDPYCHDRTFCCHWSFFFHNYPFRHYGSCKPL